MQFATTILQVSSLFAASAAAQVAQRQQQTTCVEPGFILCPPNPPSTSTGGGGSSGGPYVPPYSLGPSPFEFIKGIGGSVAAAAGKRQSQAQFCCNPKLECRMLTDYQKYICMDNKTLDFFMNDGSNGNAKSGMYYIAPEEVNINIFTGDYVYKNGTRGNGYDDTGSPRPTRDVTGSIPQPTGDVVKDNQIAETTSITKAPTATSARSQSTNTAAGGSATSAGAAAASKTPSAASSLSTSKAGALVLFFASVLYLL